MATYRSEQNKIGNKQNYTDLNLTQYPNVVDTRINNLNMKGFTNIGEGQVPDYVMAEYVNAAIDAIMAVERALGQTPMVPYDTPSESVLSTIETGTVAARMQRIENGLFDVRYGGAGWTNIAGRPTLSSHNHDGQNGHPGKINLQSEIEGLLKKINIDLTSETGLTAADLFVSKTNLQKLDVALTEFLSKKTGGTIEGPVVLQKGFHSRTHYDATASELPMLSGTVLTQDATATDGNALVATSGGTSVPLLRMDSLKRQTLLFGKYLLMARVKISGAPNANVLRFQLGENVQTVHSSELSEGYATIYFVFEQNATTKPTELVLQKLATGSTVSISLDCISIEPIHPAILDR